MTQVPSAPEAGRRFLDGAAAPAPPRRTEAPGPAPLPFRLTRHFSLASVGGIAVVLASLLVFHGYLDLNAPAPAQWQFAGGVLAGLSLLYLFLFMIVRRADRVIRAQGTQVRLAHDALLHYQSNHDSLTGLPNRASFSHRLEAMLAAAARSRTLVAVLSVDINGLQEVNDSLGHPMGDRLLADVSKRLTAGLREADITARRGGAEFAAAVSGIRGIEHVALIAENLRQSIQTPVYELDGHRLSLTGSIGIGIYPDDGTDAAELIDSADAAAHHARQSGRNNVQFHAAGMNGRALAALLIEQDLRQALERSEFLLHYQPLLDARSGRITGAEALIRWHHPGRGMILPAQFIPIAEEKGLIAAIGAWVLREACRQNRAWQQEGLAPFPVAVNLSALQFQQNDFADSIARTLEESGLEAGCLELEVTESAVMRDAEKSIATMHALKAIGVKLLLDDFGTGYSSLTQLKRFPVDKLKIDQSFVAGLPGDRYDLAISTAIVGMGKALNLKLVAEGVETAEQREILQSIGCDEVQGFHASAALPPDAFAAFVRARRPM